MSRKQIPERIRFQLVARAAGRCEYPGCNKVLYEDELTKGPGNISNYAHIIPYKENGPRGAETIHERPADVDTLDNLILLCWDHHKEIDTMPVPPKYSASELRKHKRDHERRIALVTSIKPECKSYIVSYTAYIAQGVTSISEDAARLALLPHYYPAQRDIIELSPSLPNKPQDNAWYEEAVIDLKSKYNEFILRRLNGCKSTHFSVFAIAPMPLLIQLGSLLNDTSNAMVYQKQRDAGWLWDDNAPDRTFSILPPAETECKKPVLMLMLTQEVDDILVKQALGEDVAIWKITSDYHGFDCILKNKHLIDFKSVARCALNDIARHYPNEDELHIFPIMPASACVEFGRIRTANHNPWVVYEKRRDTINFVKTISIK